MPLSEALLTRPEHDHIVLPAEATLAKAFDALMQTGGDLGYHFVVAVPGGTYRVGVAGAVAAHVLKNVQISSQGWLDLLAYSSDMDLLQMFKSAAWQQADPRFGRRLTDLPLPTVPAIDRAAMDDDRVMKWLGEQGHMLAVVLSGGKVVGIVRAHHLL